MACAILVQDFFKDVKGENAGDPSVSYGDI